MKPFLLIALTSLIFSTGCKVSTSADLPQDPPAPPPIRKMELEKTCAWVESLQQMRADQSFDFIISRVIGKTDQDYFDESYDSYVRVFGSCGSAKSFKLDFAKTYSETRYSGRTGKSQQSTLVLTYNDNVLSDYIRYSGTGVKYSNETQPYAYSAKVSRTSDGNIVLKDLEIRAENTLAFVAEGSVKTSCEQKIKGADGKDYGHKLGPKEVPYRLEIVLAPGGVQTKKEFRINSPEGQIVFDRSHSSATAGQVDTQRGLENTNDTCM